MCTAFFKSWELRVAVHPQEAELSQVQIQPEQFHGYGRNLRKRVLEAHLRAVYVNKHDSSKSSTAH